MLKKIIDKYNLPVKEILISENLISKSFNLIRELGFENKKLLLVTDQIIYEVLGQKILTNLKNQKLEKLILQNPKADEENLLKIISKLEDHDLLIAAGSGTINDLCKLASFKKNIPYIIFASAPSMNGYLSANASIIINNHKQTLPAHLPLAAYFDLDILSNAGARLIKAGIGDSLCFSTCQFDWLLSNLILETYYNNEPFELLKSYHKKLFSENFLDLKDKNFIKLLSKILIISGIGMYLSGGSYPASQGEHLIGHYLEINYPKIMSKTYHGEQIAVTTLSIVEIQEKILQIKQLQLIASTKNPDYKKFISPEKAELINQKLKENWPKIKKQLRSVFISKNDLLKLFIKFNLPQNSYDIGFDSKIYHEAISNACLIRDRFTCLDILQLQL